ncbi:MAG: ABC transporter ATP-binding protein, partial [Planctomycetes bacterium]|nr:ABC transporter ATP-binding protein [Planctomycetota bacterium]
MKALAGFRLRLRQLGETHHRFADLVRRERKLLVLAGIALIGEIAMQLATALPIKYLVDGLLVPSGKSLFLVPDGYPRAHPVQFVLWVCGFLLASTILATTLSYFRQVWSAIAGQRMVLRLRKQLYSHLQRLSLRFHRDSRHGDLIARIVGDIPALRDILSETLIDLTGRLGLAVSTLVILFVIDPILASVAVATLIAVLAISTLFGRKITKVARRQRQKEGMVAHTAGETLASVALVKAFQAEDVLVQRFSRQNRAAMRRGVEGTRLQASLSRYVEICFAVGTSVVLAVGVLRVYETAAMSAGTLLMFISFVNRLNKPLRKLSRASASIGKAAACGERIAEILSTEPEEIDAPDAVDAPPLAGAIEFRGVGFSHVADVAVLRDLDLSIDAGERVALVGENGAGKTTLIHLLLRFYEPDEGTLLYDGHESRKLTIASLRRQISLALQETLLFGTTIIENLRLAAPDATEEEVAAALETVGARFVDELPDGLDTELAEGGKNFSGGERRKIALAGAILRPGAILILDEPTTHIDAGARDDLVHRF